MTLAELENTLPCGFHDSALKSLSIDYQRRTVQLDVSLSVGDPDGPREQWDDVRDARIEISGMVFFVIDPPGPEGGFNPSNEIWIVNSYETRSIPAHTKTIDKELLEAMPAGAFSHSFFVINWNSYLHVGAMDCSLNWAGEAEHYPGPRQHFYPGESVNP